MKNEIVHNIAQLIESSSNIMVLTGAGMSSESGLPTFRGKDGYWVADGKNYHPMELATLRAFKEMPKTVWEWYFHRANVYRNAIPNPGHLALVDLEKYCETNQKQFILVTQNVDNLHQKAGSNSDNILEIHGNLLHMRCSVECKPCIYRLPERVAEIPLCPACNNLSRPHVLWFDETYNEAFYYFQTVIQKAQEMDCLFIIGTTLQTTLPANVFRIAYQRSIPITEINPNPIGLEKYGVRVIKSKVGEIFPSIIHEVIET